LGRSQALRANGAGFEIASGFLPLKPAIAGVVYCSKDFLQLRDPCCLFKCDRKSYGRSVQALRSRYKLSSQRTSPFWRTLVMQQDEIPDVVNIEFLSFEAAMLEAAQLPDLIE